MKHSQDRRAGLALRLCCFAVVGYALASPGFAQPTIKEFNLPPGADPRYVTTGPDGQLWFTSDRGFNGGDIGTIDMFGNPILKPLPQGHRPFFITTGPDGNLWFTVFDSNTSTLKIGRMTTDGTLTEFTVPSDGQVNDITRGPDGNLWFTNPSPNLGKPDKIGRITPDGQITMFSLPLGNYGPEGITAGANGDVWFTCFGGQKIGRMTTDGKFFEFPLPAGSGPTSVVLGKDGNLWISDYNANKIRKVSGTGILILSLDVPTPFGGPVKITQTSDGTLWFTEYDGNKIARVTSVPGQGIGPQEARAEITEFAIPTAGSIPEGIIQGPDGNIWFAERAGKVGRLNIAPCAMNGTTLCSNNGRFKVQVQWKTADGATGSGQANILTSDTGYFWFFSANNIEMVIKVVDGRAVNNAFWVFAAGLTNVNVVITVTDMATGTVKTYTNPQGTAFQPIQDTSAFSAASEESVLGKGGEAAGAFASAAVPAGPRGADAACSKDAATLCVNGSRFKVQVAWATPQGQNGAGQAIALTGDTGYFWFFSSNNVEMVIKVVDGRPVNNRFWVFAGGLTNVNVVITVTDTVTGAVKTYTNPQGTAFQPIQDTNAFPG